MKPEFIDSARSYLEKKNLDGYEVFHLKRKHFLADAKNVKIESLEDAKEAGLAIRIINNNRMGFSYTTSFEADRIKDCIDLAAEGSKEVEPDKAWSLAKKMDVKDFDWSCNDDSLADLPVSARTDAALALEAAALDADPGIKRVRRAIYEESRIKIRLLNSEGLDLTFDKTILACDVTAVAESSNDTQWAWDFGFSHRFKDLDVKGVGRRAAESAIALLGAKGLLTIRTPACLHPYVSAQFLQVLSKSFFGDNIFKHKSKLIGKLEEKVYSDLVNIIDDGLLNGGYGSAPFDGEGVACKKNQLLERGVIKNWLTDSYWGMKLGISSSGSSSRESVKELPSVGINNIYIQSGEADRDSLLCKMDKGFYITSIAGAHTINSITGDFSLGAEGQWIEGGKIKYPVKGVVIAGNVNDVFKNVVAVGSDLKFMGNVGAPTILVSDIQVGGQVVAR